MNIIIVDDDSLVSLSLKTILEAAGDVNVLAIGNDGKDAIELYEIHKPDVLLMDLRQLHIFLAHILMLKFFFSLHFLMMNT